MKNVCLFLIQALMALSLVYATGCSKDDPAPIDTGEPDYADGGDSGGTNTPPSDPEGTITLSVRNTSNGKTSVPLYSGIDFGIDNGNNFYSGSSWYFVSVGQVQGLGGVTKIPDAGWSTNCAVMTGYGYIGAVYYNINFAYGSNQITFVRIYVDNVIIGAGSGGVIGYMIKYQYPFNGAATAIGLSAKTIKTGQSVTLNKVSCSISPVAVNDGFKYFSFDGTKVSLTFPSGASGTYTVSSPGLSDETIVVSP